MDTLEKPRIDRSVKHVLSVLDLVEPTRLAWLFEKANFYRREMKRESPQDFNRFWGRKLERRIIATIFYQPSTRTRLSFEAAALRLGATVISTENAREFSSAIKGECTGDSGRITASYCDLMVVRHHQEGGVAEFARNSMVPVINGGDGAGEHPTQALLDLFTIWSEIKSHKHQKLQLAIVGDLKRGRTVRSLCLALASLKGSGLLEASMIYLISPPEFRMGNDVRNRLIECNINFIELNELSRDAVQSCDVIYMTRPQLEHAENKDEERHRFEGMVLNHNRLSTFIPSDCRILHPLPRNEELPTVWDDDPRACYFTQAQNGVPVRMALMEELLVGTK